MFAYFLSVAVCFIVLGTIYNALKGFGKINPNYDDNGWLWPLIVAASALWFIAIPVLSVLFVLFLLKLLTDFIAKFILKVAKK